MRLSTSKRNAPSTTEHVLTQPSAMSWREWVGVALVALLIALTMLWGTADQRSRLVDVAVTVGIAIAGSGLLFFGVNRLIDQARSDWSRFRGLLGVIVGAIAMGLLRGNLLVSSIVAEPDPIAFGAGTGILGNAEWSVAGAALGGAWGWSTGRASGRWTRVASGVLFAMLAAYLISHNLHIWHRPAFSWLSLLWWAAGTAVLGGIAGSRSMRLVQGSAIGAALGATIAMWLAPTTLGGSSSQVMLATLIPLVLLAIGLSWSHHPTVAQVADIDRRARAIAFLGPALVFLFAALVVPAVRTLYLSLLDRESENFVGLDNYRTLARDQASLDLTRWTSLFGSQLFWVALVLLLAGILIGLTIGWNRNRSVGFEATEGSVGAILLGVFLFAFAVLSTLRGTFMNNLWWVLTVTTVSTVLGLTAAVLSEQAGRLESVAKALIFMPMAVSFVGASIVWRFQYQPRHISKRQTGVLNAIWVEIGKLSHSGWPRLIVLLLLAAIIAASVNSAIKRARNGRTFAGLVAVAIVVGHLFVELFRRSLGGFAFDPNGQVIADTVSFREHAPFNNVFLMIILIWIQTGFAMVILSAAIKAVPEELLEAARIDGADKSQQFFRVILPQILPTVGVVVTTLIVLVTKVFDIVKVSTGGNFGTNVLANAMYTEAFQFFDRGLGSALAAVILLTVLPVMIFNVYQMQRDAT